MNTPSKSTPAPAKADTPTSHAWSFRYEGPPAGLAAALATHAEKQLSSPAAQAQFALAQALLNGEQALRPAAALVRVTARGDEGLVDNSPRNLALEFVVVK